MYTEVYERSGLWYYRGADGMEYSLGMKPEVVKPSNTVEDAIALKEAGFTSEEVFRLLRKEEKSK